MFVAMSIQHRFVNKITIRYGVAPEHLVVGTLEVGLDGVILCTRSSIQMMQKYSGATYRWTGVGALRAIWQEKLDVVNA